MKYEASLPPFNCISINPCILGDNIYKGGSCVLVMEFD